MYDLNYTYLTDLEVDTRQTFADISDDLILLSHNTNLEKTTAKTLISSWQDFFWNSPIEKKENLNVIFTDLSVDHSAFIKGENNFLNDNEMITVGELSNFFYTMDGNEKWCDQWTFDEMMTELSGAIKTLHTRLLNNKNIYPIGSIVVSNNNPVAGNGFGEWESKNSSYIAENLNNSSEISIGFNNGKSDGKQIGSNLDKVIVQPLLKNDGIVPNHNHDIAFDPPNGNGGSDIPEEEKGEFPTVKNIRAGKNYIPGSNGQIYSGRAITNLANNVNTSGFIVGAEYKGSRDGGGHARPTFKVDNASIEPKIKKINVAPKTYPIDGKIWERKS